MRSKRQMYIQLAVMAGLTAILFYVAWNRKDGSHVRALGNSKDLLLQILPMIVVVMLLGGLIQQLVPAAFFAKWMGAESGYRGIFIGTVAGWLAPGGPMVSFPLAVILSKAGVSNGALVSFLTSWSLWSISRVPLEVAFLGWRFTAMRFICTFFLPLIAGALAQMFFTRAGP